MLIRRDMKHAKRARAALRSIPAKQLVAMCEKAADIFLQVRPGKDFELITMLREQKSVTNHEARMRRRNDTAVWVRPA